jgi:hypothetical protein
MAFAFPNSTGYNNFRSTIYRSMAKQKLELTFFNGLIIGFALTLSVGSVIVDKYFISRDVFKLKKLYINGKMIKFCEDR